MPDTKAISVLSYTSVAQNLDRAMRTLLKSGINAVSLALALPLALLSLFGRVRAMYLTGAHIAALVPGLPGDYFRVAYYRLTLAECSLKSRISFGTVFAHAQAQVGEGAYIGSYCILGRVRIGARTQMGSMVQILSGTRQHARNSDGSLGAANLDNFQMVSIGSDCWIGASAIVMANVGDRTTIGAGAVVTREVPEDVVSVGNPARILKKADL